jgi:hypothetical protein
MKPDTTHLHVLLYRLSQERGRLAAATCRYEITLRQVWVAQLEKEVAAEYVHLDAQPQPIDDMDDDALMQELWEP